MHGRPDTMQSRRRLHACHGKVPLTENKHTTQTTPSTPPWALAKTRLTTQPSAKHRPAEHAAPPRPLRKGDRSWRTNQRARTHIRCASTTALPTSDAISEQTPLPSHSWTRTCQDWLLKTLTSARQAVSWQWKFEAPTVCVQWFS